MPGVGGLIGLILLAFVGYFIWSKVASSSPRPRESQPPAPREAQHAFEPAPSSTPPPAPEPLDPPPEPAKPPAEPQPSPEELARAGEDRRRQEEERKRQHEEDVREAAALKLLNEAKSWASNGRTETAIAKYEQLIEVYKGTKAAEEAKPLLDALKRK